MKQFSLICLGLAYLMLSASVKAAELLALPDEFVRAVHQVETSGRIGPGLVGDQGKAIGPFQIHFAYWADAQVHGRYQDCHDYNYALKVMTAYLNKYARQSIESKDYEVLSRIHNGGPKGHLRASTIVYWKKVKQELDKQNEKRKNSPGKKSN